MALAIGGSSNTLAPHGQFWTDVRDCGARGSNSFDNAPAFQSAHDALAAKLAAAPPGQRWQGTLCIASANLPYNVAKTTYIDAPNIAVVGEGNGTLIQSGNLRRNGNGNVNCPVFVVGLRRPSTIGGTYLANFANCRPDLHGKVDSTLAPTTGVRYGFRTITNTFVMAHATPFSHGAISPRFGYPFADNWAETQHLTIEFRVEGFATGGLIPANTVLFGLSDSPTMANVFPFIVLVDGNGDLRIDWQTQTVLGGPVGGYGMAFPQAAGGGPQTVTLQIDLAGAVVTGWLNGIQQYTGTGINNMSPGAFFRENDDYPFLIAGTGIEDSWAQTFNDFALYGLAMSKTLRYNVAANGSAQVRTRDNAAYATIHDNYRYNDDLSDVGDGGMTSGLIGFFNFGEPPDPTDPMLFIQDKSTGASYSAFIGAGAGIGNALPILGPEVRNMRLVNVRPYGSPLYVGQVLDATFDNLDLQGGMYAISSLPVISTYPVVISNCQFSASDAAIYLNFTAATITNSTVHSGGRAPLRFREVDANVDGMFIAGCNANCQFSILRTHNGSSGGGQITLRHILQDSESAPYASRAGIYAEAAPVGACLRLEDVSASQTPNVPFLVLDSTGTASGWPPNIAVADNVSPGGSISPVYVQSNGTKWTGQFKNMGLGQTPHLLGLETYAIGQPFKFVDTTYPAPPHAGTWYPGAHYLQAPTWVDGQYGEWRCIAKGTYGTPAPPKWAGLNPLQSMPSALAVTAFDHTVVATTAFGGSAYGWLSDQANASLLQTLFGQNGGATTTTPATLYFGLALAAPGKSATPPYEPSGGGYARASLANNLTSFPAAASGSKANGQAITWPTLSAQVANVVGLFVTDVSSGGDLLAYVHFTTPHTFASGTAPTVPIGGLTFTQTPTNVPGFLTQHGWGKVFDYWFGQAALATPATWYVGLNTAHASVAAAPNEPSGSGYARAGLTNDPSHWITGNGRGDYVAAWNGLAPTFPSPTGSGWGTALGVGIFDALTSGNAWFVADAPNAVAAGVGSAPTVAPGALLISL
jgi:hypothetical protein